VLAEEKGSQPLIGQIVLERLDLVIEPSTRKVIPNPRCPDMPMVEILMAAAFVMRPPFAQASASPNRYIKTARK